MQRVIGKLDALTTRCQERSELADFLIQASPDSLFESFLNCGHQVSSEFEFGIKENWDQINVITMEDRLDALE